MFKWFCSYLMSCLLESFIEWFEVFGIFFCMIIFGFISKKGKSKFKFYIERVNLEGRVLLFC